MTFPFLSSCMSQTMHKRSTSGLSEHKPFDKTSGNMGITRSGK